MRSLIAVRSHALPKWVELMLEWEGVWSHLYPGQ